MAEYQDNYLGLSPSLFTSLLSPESQPLSACSADASDCSTDNAEPCWTDTSDPDCTSDSGSCTSDSGCSDCSDSPCSDTPQGPPVAAGSITISSITATSVTLQLAPISKATSYVVAWRPASATVITGEEATSSLTVTITGLQPETEYLFNYYGKNSDGHGPGEEGKTCRDIGSVTSFKDKVRNHDVWKVHQRAYKKYFARTRKGTMSRTDFEAWEREPEALRDRALTTMSRQRVRSREPPL